MARKRTGALGMFEGGPVDDMAIKITRAGDGLSEALKASPNPHKSGDVCYFVLRTIVGPVNHKPHTVGLPESGYSRVEDHVAQEITEVSEDDVMGFLEEAAERLAVAREAAIRAEEEAAGITRLPLAEDVEDNASDA